MVERRARVEHRPPRRCAAIHGNSTTRSSKPTPNPLGQRARRARKSVEQALRRRARGRRTRGGASLYSCVHGSSGAYRQRRPRASRRRASSAADRARCGRAMRAYGALDRPARSSMRVVDRAQLAGQVDRRPRRSPARRAALERAQLAQRLRVEREHAPGQVVDLRPRARRRASASSRSSRAWWAVCGLIVRSSALRAAVRPGSARASAAAASRAAAHEPARGARRGRAPSPRARRPPRGSSWIACRRSAITCARRAERECVRADVGARRARRGARASSRSSKTSRSSAAAWSRSGSAHSRLGGIGVGARADRRAARSAPATSSPAS